jgi:hypothetical protein
MQQVLAQCQAASVLSDVIGGGTTPRWLTEARLPVIICGRIAFTAAFLLGLYTIFHVAQAYKHFKKRVCRHDPGWCVGVRNVFAGLSSSSRGCLLNEAQAP